jgi:hypothetical protein
MIVNPYENLNPLSARGPAPQSMQTLQVPNAASPSKIVLSDRDYSKIIKAETRRHQLELAGLYGAQINNKHHVDKLSVSRLLIIFIRKTTKSQRKGRGYSRRRGRLSWKG